MKIKVGLLTLIMIFLPFVSGCWSYKGANEIDIVSGIAIDIDEETQLYQLTVEIIDLDAASEKNSVATKYVEIEAKSILDGSRNSKRKLVNSFFLGSMEILVISEGVLKTRGLWDVLEIFMRSPEPRESLLVAVAQGVSAREVILSTGMDTSIISYGITTIIEEDPRITASTLPMQAYKVYNTLKEEGDSLVLPVVHCVKNDKDIVVESNGLAVFKEDRIMGYLTPEESRYYLFIKNEVKGGALTFALPNSDVHNVGFEIEKSKTKKSYSYENEKLKITIDIYITLNLEELIPEKNLSEIDTRSYLENQAKLVIDQGIFNILEKAKSDYGYDIFGFGNLVYKKNPKLWRELKDNWQDIFLSAEIEVNTTVAFGNTGIIHNY